MRTAFIIAACVFGAAAATAVTNKLQAPVERVQITAGKYDWGALTPFEQKEAARLIGDLDRRQVEIFCGLAGCHDLAEDIDEIMDLSKAASTVRRPVMDLGAGLGIAPADEAARRVSAAISAATSGRINLIVTDQKVPGGGLVIALGRKPRK